MTPGETLGTLYNIHVGSNKTKQHTGRLSLLLPAFAQRGGGGGGVYSYSADTIEGPRAPAVKLTARHSSLTSAPALDESDHLTLVNAGDEEVVSQEEGGRGAPQGEKKEGVVARALSNERLTVETVWRL